MKVRDKYHPSSYSSWKTYVKGRALWFYQAPLNRLVKPIPESHKFIFVCGCGHSGTSLMAARIGQHPEAYLLDRETSGFLPPRGLYVSKQLVMEWESRAVHLRKERIVEKTPKHIQRLGDMRRLLPNARFVIMVRNPLDNIASLYKRFDDLDGAIRRWIWDNKQTLKWMRSESAGVRVVKYEELTTNPTMELRSIASWLELEWSESMDAAQGGAYESSEQGTNMMLRAKQVSEDIKPRIGTWKGVLDSDAAQYVWKRTAKLAMNLGYSAL